MVEKPTNVSRSVRRAVETGKSFATFDLGLDEQDRQDLDGLRIGQKDEYNNFGDIGSLRGDAITFLVSLGNTADVAGRVAQKIESLSREVLNGFGAEAGWVCIRAAKPTDDYRVPRWHADGHYFDQHVENHRKAAITLKGDQTLLNDLPPEMRPAFNAAADGSEGPPERRKKIAALVDGTNTSSPSSGQGVVFVVGSEDKAAVHAEPDIQQDRLFISVVPGTAVQIEELRQSWKRPVTPYRKPDVAPAP